MKRQLTAEQIEKRDGATTEEIILSLQDALRDSNDERHRLEKEVDQLNKALALKLDALPSGLSAGQSVQLQKKLAFYIEACAAHQHHIDELQASFIVVGDGLIQTEKERDAALAAAIAKASGGGQ